MRLNKRIFIKALALIVLIALTLGLVACWDYQELNTVSVVLGIGVDAEEGGEDTNFIFQLNKSAPSSGQGGSTSGESESKYYNLEAKAKGLPSAVEQINGKLPRNLFMEHNQFILIGRKAAERGIEDLLDAFIREGFLRIEVWTIVADDTASDMLGVKFEQETIVAAGISKMLEDLSVNDKVFQRSRFYKFVSCNKTGAASSVIPILKKGKNMESDLVELKGLAIFDEYKMVGEMNMDQTKAYSWIMDYYKTTQLELTLPEGYAYLNVTKINSKTKLSFDSAGNPVVKLDINFIANIGELQGISEMDAVELGNFLNEKSKEQLEKNMADCIKYCQETGYDVFRFGEGFHRYHPKKWKKMKEDWDETFKTLKVEIEIEPRIFNPGKIDSSLKEKEN